MIYSLLEQLYKGESLTQQQMETAITALVIGELDQVALAAMLTALKIKGETAAEIAGAANAIRQSATKFQRPEYDFADCVGTGGDGQHTINISTTAAIVAASMGLKMAKHGNRSVSSKSGSADLLEAFGINLTMSPENARHCLDKVNICFLFAPVYHPGFKYAAPVRQALKTRTLFNVLGPLVNPAMPDSFVLGVYTPELLMPFAQAMQLLGVKNCWVVHGEGLDEIGLHGTNQIVQLKDGEISELSLTANDFGLDNYGIETIQGGEPEENATLVKAILSGQGAPAHNAAVAANVAALLIVQGKANDVKTATTMALEHINSGGALDTLNKWVLLSNQLAAEA